MSGIERVLILDDNQANILFFEMIFQNLDRTFKVFTSTSGNQADIIVKHENIHFIVCAWEMSPMPGTVFIQRVREHRSRRNLPALIFSKRLGEEDALLLREIGINNIIGMPFDKESAKSIILKMIKDEENLTPIERRIRKIETSIAEQKFTEALKLVDSSLFKAGPHKVKALTVVAEIWMATLNNDKAEQCLTQAIADEPEDPQANRLLAKLYSQTGRHTQAITLLEAMTKKSPKNIQSLICLGSAYADADRPEDAEAVFRRVDKIDANSQLTKDERGKAAFKEGRFAVAAQFLAETNNGDEIARHFNNLAISHITAQEFDKGIDTYKNAIKVLTNSAKMHQLTYNLGLAYRKKGDLDNGFKYLCESYITEPTFEKAYSALVKLSKEITANKGKLDNTLVETVKDVRNKHKE